VLREGLRLVEQARAEDALKLEVLRGGGRCWLRRIGSRRVQEFDSTDDLQVYLNGLLRKDHFTARANDDLWSSKSGTFASALIAELDFAQHPEVRRSGGIKRIPTRVRQGGRLDQQALSCSYAAAGSA